MAKHRKAREKEAGARARSAPRMIVSYVGGAWTDNLSIGRYGVDASAQGLTLRLEVAPLERPGKVRAGREAFRDFVAKRRRVESIQIGKASFARRLRSSAPDIASAGLAVRLLANGHEALYPAAIVFGPDAITLNLG